MSWTSLKYSIYSNYKSAQFKEDLDAATEGYVDAFFDKWVQMVFVVFSVC